MENTRFVGLSAPWDNFYSEIVELFGIDPDIHNISFDREDYIINLYVDNQEKYEALSAILPRAKTFGNVTVEIVVVPANSVNGMTDKELFEKAFEGNPAFSRSESIEGFFTNPITYVVFKPEVVQYHNDDIGDIDGKCTTLYKEIAKNVFDIPSVCFCTETK